MGDYPQYYSYIVGSASQYPVPASDNLPTWPHNYELQTGAGPLHFPPQIGLPRPSQDQHLHFKVPIPPRPQLDISQSDYVELVRMLSEPEWPWPFQNETASTESHFLGRSDIFLAQDPANLVPISPDFGMSGMSNDDPAPPLQVQPSFPGYLETSLAQEDPNLVPISPDFGMLGMSNNEPSPPLQAQPSFPGHLETFLAQEDPNLVTTSPDSGMSGMSSDEPVLPLQVQPSFPSQIEVFPIHGETSPKPVHDAKGAFLRTPSQSQVVQPSAPTDIPPQVCPICEKDFHRIQERDRHLRTFLPHCFFCPFERCAWRADRYFNLKEHWESKHAKSGPALSVPTQEHCEIYNPDPFVKSILRHLSTEEAAEEACLVVERRAHELGKVAVWADDAWGRKKKVHHITDSDD